jgi:type I restriction enzyme S subunit
MKNVGQDALLTIKVARPSLSEQQSIAEILLTCDEAIDGTQRLIGAKRKFLSWLRSEILTGRRRLPGYRGAWHKLRLGEILSEHKLKSSGSEEVFSVSVHKGLVNQIEHLGRSYAAKDTGHYNRVKPGDIVYTKSPTGEFPLGIIKKSTTEKDVIVSPLYGVFTPTTPHVGEMLDALFESPINTQTNQRFLDGDISIPTNVSEQAAIAEIVMTARAELKCLGEQIEIFERQKRGLMQKLLTGEWRVPVRDGDVDAMAARITEEAAQ